MSDSVVHYFCMEHQLAVPTSQSGKVRLELLVVISIAALFTAVVFIGLARAKLEAKNKRAQEDLQLIRSGLGVLTADTGKWVYGCWPEQRDVDPLDLSLSAAGVSSLPKVGDGTRGCSWSEDNLKTWRGPYASDVKDPWGNPYYYMPNYQMPSECGGSANLEPVLISLGPNGESGSPNDCDDMVMKLY